MAGFANLLAEVNRLAEISPGFVWTPADGERREWFEPIAGPAYVLWWAVAGHRPNWIEAKQRLQDLNFYGPTPYAFTFAHAFSPSGELC